MPVCLLGIGSNLGDRPATLDRAVAQLRADAALRVLAVSAWLETAAVGGPGAQGAFLNGAIKLDTSLAPGELLARLHEIERTAGRRRKLRWEARTLDLDLLLYGTQQATQRDDAGAVLTVPHPRLAMRRFVLEPAAEIAAELIDPVTGWTILQLLEHINSAPGYIAVAGPDSSDRAALARALAAALDGRLLSSSPPSSEPLEPAMTAQAALLATDGWPETAAVRRAGGPPAVSDFWFDDWPALAEQRLPQSARAEFLNRWREARATVVQPLLVVAIDPTVVPPGAAPVIRCQSARWDGITEEVCAAVAGMR